MILFSALLWSAGSTLQRPIQRPTEATEEIATWRGGSECQLALTLESLCLLRSHNVFNRKWKHENFCGRFDGHLSSWWDSSASHSKYHRLPWHLFSKVQEEKSLNYFSSLVLMNVSSAVRQLNANINIHIPEGFAWWWCCGSCSSDLFSQFMKTLSFQEEIKK